MTERVVIQWEQSRMGATLLDTWFARVTDPVRTEIFAAVRLSIHGQWFAHVSPRGRAVLEPQIYVDYASREKAMAHIERWAQHHWKNFPVWKHPLERR